MVLDSETTGLPIMKDYNKFHSPESYEHYKDCRLIELGYIIYSKDGRKINEYEFIVKPHNFTIRNYHIHGITNTTAIKNGKDISAVLDELDKNLDKIDLIVGHNIMFDISVVLSECHRNKKKDLILKLISKPFICTMELGKEIYGSNLNLQTLYRSLHNKYITQKHRALDDAYMCADCYFCLLHAK